MSTTGTQEQLLTFSGVEVAYHGKPVLHDLTFSLHAGEILGIVGESGSGKSTILRAAMGLLGQSGRITSGDILWQGKSLLSLSEGAMRALRGARLSMVFQDAGASLCPVRTIESQIYEALRAHQRISRQEAKARTLTLLEKLGFSDGERILKSYPFALSGGMNQRVGIAMAMLLEPGALLADEPTSALDVAVQKQVLSELLRLRELFGTAIVLVTHDIGVVSAMADTVLVLKDGRAVEYGTAAQVLYAPQHAYTRQLLAAVPRLRRD